MFNDYKTSNVQPINNESYYDEYDLHEDFVCGFCSVFIYNLLVECQNFNLDFCIFEKIYIMWMQT